MTILGLAESFKTIKAYDVNFTMNLQDLLYLHIHLSGTEPLSDIVFTYILELKYVRKKMFMDKK